MARGRCCICIRPCRADVTIQYAGPGPGIVCPSHPAVTRLLALALVATFCPAELEDPNSRARALLERPTRWAVEDRMLQLVTGILGLAIGSSATGSGGPLTPRRGSSGGGGGVGGGGWGLPPGTPVSAS